MESAERVDGFLMASVRCIRSLCHREGSPRLRHFAEIAASLAMALCTWFGGGRAEVDHFTSAPRRSVPGLLGGAAVCGRPSRVARQAPPTHESVAHVPPCSP